MKKKFLFLLLIMLFPIVANAKTVTVSSFEDVKANNVEGDVIEYTGSSLNLTEDFTLKAFLKINANTTLNLNNHVLTIADHGGSQYPVIVYDSLTINGEGTVTINDIYGFQTYTSGSPKIIINGGTFNQTGDYYMFGLTNGEITFNGGSFTTPYCVVNNFAGYYRANYSQYSNASGTITVNEGTFITTDDWDETIINSDQLLILGGEFTSNGDSGSVIYNDPTGTAEVRRGFLTANGNDAVTVYNEGNIILENGSFDAPNGSTVYNDNSTNANATLTLVGGGYSDAESAIENYVDDNSVGYTNDHGETIVVPEDRLVLKVFPVAANPSQTDEDLVNSALESGFEVASFYDVTAWLTNPNDNNFKVEQLDESSSKVKVTLTLPSDLPAVPAGYKRVFKIIRIHNGDVAVLDATDNGNGTVSAMSDKFSTYAVSYRDVKSTQNRETSTSTSSSSNPKTGDPIVIFMILMVIGLVGGFVTVKKLANR